jgi:hypothetical protein
MCDNQHINNFTANELGLTLPPFKIISIPDFDHNYWLPFTDEENRPLLGQSLSKDNFSNADI